MEDNTHCKTMMIYKQRVLYEISPIIIIIKKNKKNLNDYVAASIYFIESRASCVCVCVCVYTRKKNLICVYIKYIYTHKLSHKCALTHIYMYVNTYRCIHTCHYIYTQRNIYIYTPTNACVNAHMNYIYIDR